MKLTEHEEQLLREHYEYGDFDNLCKLMNKKKHAISELARKRGLKRKIDTTRGGNLTPLFSKTLESFYWLGQIAADGYVSKRGHFMYSQAEKDKDTVEKLAVYLGSSVYSYGKSTESFSPEGMTYRVNISDINLGKKLREMFGLLPDQKKTYTGIKLDFIQTADQATAFLIGYLDGDGSLNKKMYRVECDISWFQTFKDLINKLSKELDDQTLLQIKFKKSQNKDFCQFSIRTTGANYLRKFAKDNNLPASKRKFTLSA